jgi:hypothetical protein
LATRQNGFSHQRLAIAVLIANTGSWSMAAMRRAPSRKEMWLTTTSTFSPGLMTSAFSCPRTS